MSEALINPKVIRWAIERAQIDEAGLVKPVGVKVEKINVWLTGEARPTFRQAQILANVLRVPLGYLYLDEPPEEVLPIPDLRAVNDR